eukprot:gnl/TRDRNA2_/TRDRNA2_155216_c0_seq1.p1 gnl/TRDRNA2_/TRDRNA2_155216_c0~~gnl/TRDRNA2_/TRDRNA2_155216_c0_seq1.p1  ORF type:complete len:665 (+),score=100.38 gnl/TRDRNA2_/TRDRNA2_155216_c0_seq1:190-1995(+)
MRRDEKDWPSLQPTVAHRALTAMYRSGFLHGWIQQNHDGLPQKAGMPQDAINEIHGSWFDPSNPTVGFGDPLRADLFADLLAEEFRCDLCLALGTSLCDTPSTADRVAVMPGLRALGCRPALAGCTLGGAGGLVIVALQRTRLDSLASVRIYAHLDDVLAALAVELGLPQAALLSTPQTSREQESPLQPGDEVVVASGPDRGCPVRVRRRLEGGELELQLLGAPGAPPRRALLGSWWLATPSIPSSLVPVGSDVAAPPSLVTLLPLLPPWAAAMASLPPGGRSGAGQAVVANEASVVALELEGLWEGFAASADAGPHREAQPLRLVLAWSGMGGLLFGAGYTAWPAAGAVNARGRTFFVITGEARPDGRVRIVQRWECGAPGGNNGSHDDAATEDGVPTESFSQATRCKSGYGLQLAGAWRRATGQPRTGALVLTRVPARWAGRWERQCAGQEDVGKRWALAAVPPLMFGAAQTPESAQAAADTVLQSPCLLRGSFAPPSAADKHERAFELWLHSELPCRGSAMPASTEDDVSILQLCGMLEGNETGEPQLSGRGLTGMRLVGPGPPVSTLSPPLGPNEPPSRVSDELVRALQRYCRKAPR